MLSAGEFAGSCRDVVVYLCQKDPVLAENIMAKCKLKGMDELRCVRKTMRSKQPATQKVPPLTRKKFMDALFDLVNVYDKTNSKRGEKFKRIMNQLEMDQFKKSKEIFSKL